MHRDALLYLFAALPFESFHFYVLQGEAWHANLQSNLD
jgi:hypothetical protein